MTRRVCFAYPGDLDTRSGGYGYDRRVIVELRKLGWTVDLVPLGDGFPHPGETVLAEAKEALAVLPAGSLVLVDGLAYGVLAETAEALSARLRLVALVHHPLALEGALPEPIRARLEQLERRSLSYAKAVLVTSASTRDLLAKNYGVPADKITVAVPGTDRGIPARGKAGSPQIVSIGSIIPRKGHDVLVSALASITDLPWHCRIVGSRTMDAECDAALERQIEQNGLSDRIALVGPVDDSRAELARSDIFALASRYEGYGMVFAEALSHGLPIVACRAGAVPEVVPEKAGILVAPDSPVAFAEALRRLLVDPELKQRMAEASLRSGALLPAWATTAALCSTVLERVANERV
ncbi:MAG: glycosyltransferase family 4 protein [Phyllobacterium sp.]